MSVLYVKMGDENMMFDHSFTAGRGSDTRHPELVVDDQYASVVHAGFTLHDEGWYVQDMGTTNGTWVNDVLSDGRCTYAPSARVWEPVLLRRGDKIRVGKTVLICVPA